MCLTMHIITRTELPAGQYLPVKVAPSITDPSQTDAIRGVSRQRPLASETTRCALIPLAAACGFEVKREFMSPSRKWLLLVPVVVFGLLMQRHDRVLRRRTAALRAIAFYQRGIARIEDVWAGTGESGDRFRDDHHLYANDLDLFGNGSLFQLLSIAATPAGRCRADERRAGLGRDGGPGGGPRRADASPIRPTGFPVGSRRGSRPRRRR